MRPLLGRIAFLTACVLGAGANAAAPAQAADRLGAGVAKPTVTGQKWTSAEIAGLGASVDAALAGSATLRGAHVGIVAVDARDGGLLYERNGDDAFQPASSLKLVVGSAALDKLGPEFRFRTVAAAGGAVIGGELRGPLILRGSGDVLLDDAALGGIPAALRAAGVAAVHGVTFDEPEGLPAYLPGWSWDDLPWYYAAPVTRLGLNDNQITLRIAPGVAAGAPPAVTVEPWGSVCYPAAPCRLDLGFRIVVAALTGPAGSPNTLDVTRPAVADGVDEVRLIGSLALGAPVERFALAVPRPPAYAAAAAVRALSAAGVAVLAPLPAAIPPAGAPVLWSHDSEPLRDMLADLWLPSDNVLAEELLRAVGAAEPAVQGTSASGIAWEKSWLKQLGVDVEAIAIEDGSGLSVYDRITPRDLVVVLQHDWDGRYRDVVLDALPIAGVRGTLRSSFTGTPAEGRVFAKTGSLSHVSALAGYAANARHGAVVFAFMVDDWVGQAAALRDVRARVLAAFVER